MRNHFAGSFITISRARIGDQAFGAAILRQAVEMKRKIANSFLSREFHRRRHVNAA
jgi:hypothetical protein